MSTQRIFAALALVCVLGLAACGSERSTLGPAAWSALKGILNNAKAAPLTTEVLRARLTPEVRAQIGVPMLIIELPKQKVAAVVIYAEQNGPHTTWFAQDNVGVTTKAGMVTGTRGIGFDLMAADVAGPLSVVTGKGTGQALRVQRYLDGENQQVVVRFECVYTSPKMAQSAKSTRLVYETCSNTTLQIENQYWLNSKREIIRSVQWAGSRNGYMLLEGPIQP